MDFVDPASLTQRHCLEDSDEEDDSFTPDSDTEAFIVPKDAGVPTPGSSLIITVGQPASIFAKSYLSLDPLPSCTISTESPTIFKDRYFTSPSKHPNYVVSEGFAVAGSTGTEQFHLCAVEKQLNSRLCTLWCSKVMEMFRPKLVLVLTSCKAHEYLSCYPKESDSGPAHTLKALQSNTWTLQPVASNLESPNTVIGEAAAALTHCQLQGVPGAMVICYSESTQSTAECVAAFQPVLCHSLLQDRLVIKSKEEAALKIKKLIPRPREDLSGLYT